MQNVQEQQQPRYAGDEELQYAQAASDLFADQPVAQVDLTPLSTIFLAEFAQAQQDRRETEERWLQDLRQYRGKYAPEVEKDLANRSKSFVRKTRVKVKTVDSRVADLAFPAGSEKNWTLSPTPKPSIDPQLRQQIVQTMMQAAGGQQPPNEVVDQAVLELAQKRAQSMSTTIEDQLAETRYKKVSLAVQHSGHLYGTGILKGPLVEKKVRTRFAQKGDAWQAQSEEYIVPFIESVPVWRWYPDMSATELAQCRFVYELHRMTKADMAALASRKSFNGPAIRAYVLSHPDGELVHKHFETELKSLGERWSTMTQNAGQYEVLERWGWIDGCHLAQLGVKVPAERLHEPFFANVWMLPNGEVIKAVLQPIDGVTWPYHLYYFDKDETTIFPEGLASIMRDDQDMLNAAVRMMLDNGAITSGPMVEILMDLLASTEGAEDIGPWKVYLRNNKAPGEKAVRAIEIPNHIEWLEKMAERFEINADETTAVPRYMSGENATQGAAGTARGMSMLMGAANIVIKDLLSDWDELVREFLTALYMWNMKFNRDADIKGDFDIVIRGTASLVAKEVRAQQMEAFAQQVANPMDAPFIKRDELLRERANALEMSNIVKTKDEVNAEQDSEQAKKQQELAERLRNAQVAEAEAKALKLQQEAQRTSREADLLIARVKETMANIDQIIAKTVETKVETIFAALQGGGVATRDPVTAPAGDEILRSAGYKDVTPNPSIAELDRPPVQQQSTDQALLNKGQSFAADPRAVSQNGQDGGSVQDAKQMPGDPAAGVTDTTLHPQHVVQPGPASDPMAHKLPDANTGQQAGIETTRIES